MKEIKVSVFFESFGKDSKNRYILKLKEDLFAYVFNDYLMGNKHFKRICFLKNMDLYTNKGVIKFNDIEKNIPIFFYKKEIRKEDLVVDKRFLDV